ncbi:hypothetical protein CEXT_623721 [Caerostris extrusa]|uniref:Uncharacterized protein n=1 Tax=Caerostris extrusa TaxID=172846 RepID=A0AAV4Y407_CAEEX|nr:hypothetical protein CEXT_623721 [Caerostris extrusa]
MCAIEKKKLAKGNDGQIDSLWFYIIKQLREVVLENRKKLSFLRKTFGVVPEFVIPLKNYLKLQFTYMDIDKDIPLQIVVKMYHKIFLSIAPKLSSLVASHTYVSSAQVAADNVANYSTYFTSKAPFISNEQSL